MDLSTEMRLVDSDVWMPLESTIMYSRSAIPKKRDRAYARTFSS